MAAITHNTSKYSIPEWLWKRSVWPECENAGAENMVKDIGR